MAEGIKAGDVVWIRERLVERPPAATDPGDAVYIEQIDGTVMWAPQDKVISDHPCLPAVARWLVEHPEAAMDLDECLYSARKDIRIEDKCLDLLAALIAALNVTEETTTCS